MRIVSFDPASTRNLGWCYALVRLKSDKISSFEFKDETYSVPQCAAIWQGLWPIEQFVESLLDQYDPGLVILEKTSAFAGSFITGQISNTIGVILSKCARRGLDVEFVYPTHVKKVITGSGKATKSQVKCGVKSKLAQFEIPGDYKFNSEHSCDAMANILTYLIDTGYMAEISESPRRVVKCPQKQ